MARTGYLALILQLCKHYGWEFDFWRGMGMRQFDAICDTTSRQQTRSSSPDNWDGEDPWFDEQHRRARG